MKINFCLKRLIQGLNYSSYHRYPYIYIMGDTAKIDYEFVGSIAFFDSSDQKREVKIPLQANYYWKEYILKKL